MLLTTLLLAAFLSSGSLQAVPLSSLEEGMSDLIYDLSQSVVTVESIRRLSQPSPSGSVTESVHTLVTSGIVLDTSGYIITSAGAVLGQEAVTVQFEQQRLVATVVGVDYQTELALLRVGIPVGVPARLSAGQVCAGQMVVALGNAYGIRAAPAIGFCAGNREDGISQFTVQVAAGSIGGGIFDLRGRLLGVMLGAAGEDGRWAVAVPAYRLPDAVQYLSRYGDRKAGFIGVSSTDVEVTSNSRSHLPMQLTSVGTPPSVASRRGVIVTYVAPGSPAAQAGIKAGDVLLAYNRQAVPSSMQLARLVRQSIPGSIVAVEFMRNGTYADVNLTVGEKRLAGAGMSISPRPAAPPLTADSLARLLEYIRREASRLESELPPSR